MELEPFCIAEVGAKKPSSACAAPPCSPRQLVMN